ncbi:hypothetical protein [Halioxenophilus aromaticivorans]|uniref:Uncharacterized protein n=1 Tax=Halioxenophilus aromaticivorans TaxID=1306992 RepID=A0AAV3TZM0_9ALTE
MTKMNQKEECIAAFKLQISEQQANNSGSVADFLIEKLVEMQLQYNEQDKKIERLQKTIQRSELFFSLDEVTLISTNKFNDYTLRAEDAILPTDNFYECEKRGDNDFIRWTGPAKFNNFIVPVDRSQSRVLRFVIAGAIKRELLALLKIYVDNEILKVDVEEKGGFLTYTGVLPASARKQDTVVTLYCPEVSSPMEVNQNSTDKRVLGVAFQRMEIS